MSYSSASPTTYLDIIRRGAQWYGNRQAITYKHHVLTYSDVDTLSDKLTTLFGCHGMKSGQYVGILLNNSQYTIPLDFACVKFGIVRVPLNSRLSAREHIHMLTDTSADFLIYSDALKERALEIKAALPKITLLGIDATAGGSPDLIAESVSAPPANITRVADPDEPVMTLFTSGTTGTLKAVVFTQQTYAAACKNILLNLMDVRADHVMLHAASMIHASGMFVLPFWIRGARCVIMDHFTPKEYLQTIEREKVTAINMVPTMLQMLIHEPGFATADVSHLKYLIYGASPMPRSVIQEAMRLWGRDKFYQYYGQTECPLCIAVLRPENHDPELLSSVGRPSVDVGVRIVDEQGNDVPPGEVGEIALRGGPTMPGYFNADNLNDQMFLPGGWLRSRDIGYMSEDGFLFLRDRTSDMIISGGYNVYPREVEDMIMECPEIKECAVVGLPHEKWVEEVVGVVVLAAGETLSAEELISYVRTRLADYKVPKRIEFVAEIPKTAVGKLSRKLVRESLGKSN